MAGAIKAACPTATIVFIGRRYTEFLVRASRYVDEFFDAELAKRDVDAVAAQKLDILLNPYRWSEIARTAARARAGADRQLSPSQYPPPRVQSFRLLWPRPNRTEWGRTQPTRFGGARIAP